MASLDVDSLFTNIPLDETINIIIGKLFSESETVYIRLLQKITKQDREGGGWGHGIFRGIEEGAGVEIPGVN